MAYKRDENGVFHKVKDSKKADVGPATETAARIAQLETMIAAKDSDLARMEKFAGMGDAEIKECAKSKEIDIKGMSRADIVEELMKIQE